MIKKNRGTLKFLFLIILLFVSFGLSLYFGAEKPDRFIVLNLRLPRSILVLISGCLLASSGCVFQFYFQNPLAEPGLMGISAGATLGAVLSVVSGVFTFFNGFVSSLSIFAFLGALLSGGILCLLANLGKTKMNNVILLLCGTAMGTFFGAISSSLLLMNKNELYGIYSWLLGSFNGRGLHDLEFLILPSVLSIIIMCFTVPYLDLMNGGERNASQLGVNVSLLRSLVLVSGSLAISVAVCAGGTISFVGLIAPHIMRRLFSSKAKTLLLSSALGGGILLLVSDTIARVIMRPGELPCGIVTSFLGVPFFFFLILSGLKKKGSL